MKGMLVCSFALRDEEPSPCNFRLAEAVERIVEATPEKMIIVSQWEVAKKLLADGVKLCHVVEPLEDGSYLDTTRVWAEARPIFVAQGVEELIIVANPFIHGFYIERMVQKDGFRLDGQYNNLIGKIGFDRESKQWWTRGPFRLLLYLALSAVGMAKYCRR